MKVRLDNCKGHFVRSIRRIGSTCFQRFVQTAFVPFQLTDQYDTGSLDFDFSRKGLVTRSLLLTMGRTEASLMDGDWIQLFFDDAGPG